MNNYLGNDLTVRIYSITGQLMLKRNHLTNSPLTINTDKLSKGCYIIEMSNTHGFAKREKLIIK